MATSVKNASGGYDITGSTSATVPDTLTGSLYSDLYMVNSLANIIKEPVETDGRSPQYQVPSYGGIDTIKTTVLNSMGAFSLESLRAIENLTYAGTAAATLKGNDTDNIIKANASTLTNDVLYGGKGNDQLFGYGGADNLQGGDGSDRLDGGADTTADVLIGGSGNDTYLNVTNADIVVETARGGFDTISTGASGGRYLNLLNFANIEGLKYVSSTAATLQGNTAANAIDATGSTGANMLYGYEGNDTLTGGSGADKLYGGSGDDILNGNTGSDTMTGGTGNDTYYSNVSTDVISELAGEGIDTLVGVKTSIAVSAYATTIENLIYTGASDVAVTGNEMANVVVGGSGKNTVSGNGGNDIVIGGAGADTVQGGIGNDMLYGGIVSDMDKSAALLNRQAGFTHSADGAADVLVGSAGSDAYLIDETADKITELSTDAGTDVIAATIDLSLAAYANVEALVLTETTDGTSPWYGGGSARADVIVGNSDENYLSGGLGNDILTGDIDGIARSYGYPYGNDFSDVTDVIDGGDGDDVLLAMGEMQTSTSGYWDPVLNRYVTITSTTFESNVDNVLLGGAGNDFYVEMDSAAEIVDSSGSDTLYLMTSDTDGGLDGIERIVLAGGSASDDARALSAINRVREAAGMVSGASVSAPSYPGTPSPYEKLDAIPTSAALDAAGNDLANTIYGNANNNRLSGAGGNDTLYGGAGNDVLNGGSGNDKLVGGKGDDVYEVDSGDTVTELAGEGMDMIRSATLTSYAAYANVEGLEYTGSTSVKLENNATNMTADRLYGGAGNDTINGYGGNDELRGNAGNDSINGGDGNDVLQGDAGADAINGGNGDDRIYGADAASIYGTVSADAGNTIYGGAGRDTVYGAAGADKLYGDAGDDEISGGLGADTIDGGDGNDVLNADSTSLMSNDASANILTGGAGNDRINGAAGADQLSGGDGNDTIYGYAGNDKINGDAGEDYIYGDAGNDTIDGGAGRDYIRADEGNDTILADAGGNDSLYGEEGDDILYAGKITIANQLIDGADTLYGDFDMNMTGYGKDLFRFNGEALTAGFNGTFGPGHRIADFTQGDDQFQVARALVGDGDATIEGAIVKDAAGGTFSSSAELVIVRADLTQPFSTMWGSVMPINAADVISTIGSGNAAFATGSKRLFVVDDGSSSAVFQFTSSDADATITSNELKLVGVVTDEAGMLASDFGLY